MGNLHRRKTSVHLTLGATNTVTELYQAIAPALPVGALLLSILSLLVSLRNRADQRRSLMLGKKTELIGMLAQRQSKLGYLELVYLQKLKFLHEQSNNPNEAERIQANLALVQREQKNCDFQLSKIRSTEPTDLRAFESMLATGTEFLTHVSGELEKEQVVFKELQEASSESRT